MSERAGGAIAAPRGRGRSPRSTPGRYSLALLVSVALLFVLEPMVGKFALQLFGAKGAARSADAGDDRSAPACDAPVADVAAATAQQRIKCRRLRVDY